MNGTKPRWLVVLLIATSAAVSGCRRPAPSDTIKKFHLAVQDKRYDEAMERISKEFRQIIDTARYCGLQSVSLCSVG
jgi:hypothetical protein